MQTQKIALSVVVVIAFIGYSLGLHHDASEHTVSLPTSSGSTGTSSTKNNNSSAKSSEGSSNNSSPSNPNPPTTTYKDGTYTGEAADAFYGNVQVQVTISGGKLTDVQFLQYPNDRRTSQEINQQATPLLRQEALQAQSAQVDGVTGATDTSQAFIQSLSSALSQANA